MLNVNNTALRLVPVASSRPKLDPYLVAAFCLLLGIGFLMVYSTTAMRSVEMSGSPLTMLKQHFLHVCLGFVAGAVCYLLKPAKWKALGPYILIFSLSLLALTLIPGLGYVAGGARRWLVLGPLRLQAGELAKLCAVVFFAFYIDRNSSRMTNFISGIVVPLSILGSFAMLLLLQPDFGSTVVIVSVVFCQLFLYCRLRHMLLLLTLGVLSFSMLVFFSPYRLRRVLAFLDPFSVADSSGYQLVQSLIAVGSGGLSGVGLGASKQKLSYLPAAHTDFIFAVWAEEFGLLGAFLLISAFILLFFRGMKLVRRFSRSPFLACLSLGCLMLIVLPAFLNMGVVSGMLPTKGLVLPFVAYGGTATVLYFSVAGILLRLSRTLADDL